MTIQHMHFACQITKATDTHSEYVIVIAFPQQRLLREHASMLMVYIHCLSCSFFSVSHSCINFHCSDAYKVACLGVTDGDWECLAHAALEDLNFSVARQAFIRIKDLKYLELINEFQV
jgi:hypothetical protein